MPNQRILCISDLHCPYQHVDALKFLAAIKDKYNPDRVICIGDELDNHAMSFHDSDPSLASAGDELKRGRDVIWQVEELFPKVDVLESNHGSLAYRKAKVGGVSKEWLRPYKDVLGTKKWDWHFELTVTLPDKNPCYFHHGRSANTKTYTTNMGMSAIQGHYHEKFEIVYWGNSERLNFGMTVGCLVDDKCVAFEYNNSNLKRPVIGCGMIIDSQPRLMPMVLNKNGRWNGRLT